MDVEEGKVSSGYAKPPWIFKGRHETPFLLLLLFKNLPSLLLNVAKFFILIVLFSALYQIHLVKAATARAFIPKELRLVEAFGYLTRLLCLKLSYFKTVETIIVLM